MGKLEHGVTLSHEDEWVAHGVTIVKGIVRTGKRLTNRLPKLSLITP